MDDPRTVLAARLLERAQELVQTDPRRAAEALDDAAELLRLATLRRAGPPLADPRRDLPADPTGL